MAGKEQQASSKPVLEWIAVALGLSVTLGLMGFIGWQALSSSKDEPPKIVVETGDVQRYSAGWVVELTVRNLSPTSAAGVEIEGTLRQGVGEMTSSATLDYLPGHSTRQAGLFLTQDPAAGQLEVRATAYVAP